MRVVLIHVRIVVPENRIPLFATTRQKRKTPRKRGVSPVVTS
jgi:hypothetical protein